MTLSVALTVPLSREIICSTGPPGTAAILVVAADRQRVGMSKRCGDA
jgi:hypothetical protein